jgi:hypothetical protein
MQEGEQTSAGDEDSNPFITLDVLLWQGVTILNLVTAIEQNGIYIWDRFDRLKLAADADKGRALELLGQEYDWRTDPESVAEMPISPLEMGYANKHSGDDDRYNPYDDFGWPKSELPVFDKVRPSQTLPITSSPTACNDFCTLPNLRWDEVTISLVGDKGDGLAGNNMLEIRARDITRRITLGEADLVDRRSGSLNYQSAVLVRMAMGEAVRRTEKAGDMSAVMKHLRNALRRLLGLTDDPFHRHHKERGWLPFFQLIDQRGLADQRAAIAAERRTGSYDQLQDIGVQFEAKGDTGEGEVDTADDWLTKNDRTWRG